MFCIVFVSFLFILSCGIFSLVVFLVGDVDFDVVDFDDVDFDR